MIELKTDFQTAWDALMLDRPGLFFLDAEMLR